ncbi:hypothetical protein [Gilvimarinus polysaccharolyticus]|uniref:hypothetical protein n=1 Tax=Gilvimarinus polysaccharolyticus TaxID=863921 RepID=UPI000673C5FD|nr:hypothetical protein [Gilvimarinus polysaccharolyticus]
MKLILSGAVSGFLAFAAGAQAQDNVRLESIITGNQEQPQVLYLVPWQTPASPTLKYDVINNQSVAVFEHLERSELLRELKYLPPLTAQSSAEVSEPSSAAPAQQSAAQAQTTQQASQSAP